jgi:hypothetical protein
LIIQSTQQRGKRRNKEREDPSLRQRKQNPKWITKGQRNRSCSKAPPITRSTFEKEKDEKLEKAISLEEH